MPSAEWLSEKIQADFSAYNVAADVWFGGEKELIAPGPRRVVVGLGPTFTAGSPAGPNQPGFRLVAVGPGGEQYAARSLMTLGTTAELMVRGVPPPGSERDPLRSRLAHRDALALLEATLAAIYRCAHGSYRVLSGSWVRLKGADLSYGSVARMMLELNKPVLDRPWQRVALDPAASVSRLYAEFADGTKVLVSETPSP